jgi:phage I-like protein
MALLTPASLQVSNTARGTAKYAINSIALYDTDTSAQKTISSTSIDYWNAKLDSAELSAYVAKSTYDDLYSAFTALSGVISTYSGWFSELSSISAKVDNSAIGVIE